MNWDRSVAGVIHLDSAAAFAVTVEARAAGTGGASAAWAARTTAATVRSIIGTAGGCACFCRFAFRGC
jgi:hypothetical protein